MFSRTMILMVASLSFAFVTVAHAENYKCLFSVNIAPKKTCDISAASGAGRSCDYKFDENISATCCADPWRIYCTLYSGAHDSLCAQMNEGSAQSPDTFRAITQQPGFLAGGTTSSQASDLTVGYRATSSAPVFDAYCTK